MSQYLHEDPERTTPIGLFRYATEYLQASQACNERLNPKYGVFETVAPSPVLFLIGQAIELGLKAYLVEQGVSLRSVRLDYGHDFLKSIKKSKELGFPWALKLSNDEKLLLSILNTLYSTKQLQYIVIGRSLSVKYSFIEPLAISLLRDVGRALGIPIQHIP
jgi:hypothetical protein